MKQLEIWTLDIWRYWGITVNFFTCNNDTGLFLKSAYHLKIYTEIFMEEMVCLEFASKYWAKP